MKKLVFLLAGGMFIASCNRDQSTLAPAGTSDESQMNLEHYEKSDLDGMITPMNQNFGFNAKGDALVQQLNFTYRGWAEPVRLDLSKSDLWPTAPTGTQFVELAAAAAWAQNDLVFVAWHAHQVGGKNTGVENFNAPGDLLGGAITAYKQVGIGQYEFTDRIDFYDMDAYELYGARNEADGNYEMIIAGQRSQKASGYLLNDHAGAVVTRINYDYINDEFFEGSIRQMPLPGVAATDVTGAGKMFFATTENINGRSTTSNSGTAQSGIFEFDRSLTNVAAAHMGNGGAYQYWSIAFDPQTRTASSSDLFALNVSNFQRFSPSWVLANERTNWNGAAPTNVSSGFVSNINDRMDITIATSADNPFTPLNPSDALARGLGNRIFFSGPDMPLYVVNEGAGTISTVSTIASRPTIGEVYSTEYDAGLDVLYCAMAGNGSAPSTGKAIKVLALSEFAKVSPLIDEFDVVGEFVAPALGAKITSWGASWTPDLEDSKELIVFGSRNIAIAGGNEGVFFVQRDKLN